MSKYKIVDDAYDNVISELDGKQKSLLRHLESDIQFLLETIADGTFDREVHLFETYEQIGDMMQNYFPIESEFAPIFDKIASETVQH